MRARRHDVLVIGAGAAGLSAARALASAGLDVGIIEARDRTGGRILTWRDPAAPIPLELGAEFIHGVPESSWRQVRERGLVAREATDRHDWLQRRSLRAVPDFWPHLGRVLGGAWDSRVEDRGFRQWLDARPGLSSADRRFALAFVEGFDAADPDRISARAIANDEASASGLQLERSFRLLQGHDLLLMDPHGSPSLGKTLYLGAAVREVHWEPGAVRVRTARADGSESGSFEARRLVLAIPAGVWKGAPESPGGIRFSPELRKKDQALRHVEMGEVKKVILCFRTRFWERRDPGLAFFHADPGASAFPTWWTQHPSQVAVLTGWAGGPAARRIAHLDGDALLNEALKSLRVFLGIPERRLRREMQAFYSHDWQADPFSRGAYGYLGPGGISSPRVLAEPLAGTLFFAGEATAWEGLIGTVDGALSSGERAARELLSESGMRLLRAA